MIKLFIMIVMLFSTTANATGFSKEQYEILELAHAIGKERNLQVTLTGIVWKETRAGLIGPVGDQMNQPCKRSYGLAQVKINSAIDAMDRCPELYFEYSSPEEISAKLIMDDVWNLRISACYLDMLRQRGLSWRAYILAYNRGYVGSLRYEPETHPYVMDVVHSVTQGELKEFINNRR